MADGGLTVLDGTHLRDPDLRLPIAGGAVTGAKLLEMAESEASARLFGLSLPGALRSAALSRLNANGDGFLSKEFDGVESQTEMVQEYLAALADELNDDPLVISVLDGAALKLYLDDEDDFAMLAENLFTDLDVNDKGKISKSEIQNALVKMGVANGVPPFSDFSDLLNNILKKYGAEGEEQLGQAQFAQLLQTVLQDLADILAEKHVTVIQNIKVFNGSMLKKILANKKFFDDMVETMFQDWNAIRNGTGNKAKLRGLFEAKGQELGIPSSESNVAVALLYEEIFSGVDEERVSRDLNRHAFEEVVKVIFEMLAQQLEANPVFIDMES